MTPTHVIDANVVAAWFLNRPWSPAAARFLGKQFQLIAPDILVYEIGNVMWENVRTGAIDSDKANEFYLTFQNIVEIVPGADFRHEALRFALQFNHSIYDCFYLALSQQTGKPLITADRKLAALAHQAQLKPVLLR